jgi:hypothetical protein
MSEIRYDYLLFNQTPETLRRIGSRGGKAQARNRRARRSRSAAPVSRSPVGAPLEAHVETTAAAMATLDEWFPWLRGAERRGWNRA